MLSAYHPPNVFPPQAFVKMVGSNVGAMEEQVTQAEGELGTLPGAFKKILRTMSVPGFLNVRTLPVLLWVICKGEDSAVLRGVHTQREGATRSHRK